MLKRGLWQYSTQNYVHRADNGMRYNDHELKEQLVKRDEMLRKRDAVKKERTVVEEKVEEES